MATEERACLDDCPFLDTMDLLSRRYALCILWSLQLESPKRFSDIRRDLDVNPVTLSQRLKDFEAAGILTRTAHSTIPPRVDYALTTKGLDLLPILDTLQDWSDKWPAGGAPRARGATRTAARDGRAASSHATRAKDDAIVPAARP
jgi:DNA-binding HxlR family transcriptional regulator